MQRDVQGVLTPDHFQVTPTECPGTQQPHPVRYHNVLDVLDHGLKHEWPYSTVALSSADKGHVEGMIMV